MAGTFRSGAFVIDVSTSTAVGGGFSIANPEGVGLIITQAVLDISAASSSTGTMSIGVSTAAGSTFITGGLLFDALTTTAANPLSNQSSGNAGTSGVPSVLWSSGNYLLGNHSNAQSSSFVADLILNYVRRAT